MMYLPRPSLVENPHRFGPFIPVSYEPVPMGALVPVQTCSAPARFRTGLNLTFGTNRYQRFAAEVGPARAAFGTGSYQVLQPYNNSTRAISPFLSSSPTYFQYFSSNTLQQISIFLHHFVKIGGTHLSK